MDIFAAAALATDSPPDDILQRQPDPRGRHIVSPTMWKMILGQAVYQLVVVFTLHYGGHGYFGSDPDGYQYQAFILNTYIMLQIFNQWKYVVPPPLLPHQKDNPDTPPAAEEPTTPSTFSPTSTATPSSSSSSSAPSPAKPSSSSKAATPSRPHPSRAPSGVGPSSSAPSPSPLEPPSAASRMQPSSL